MKVELDHEDLVNLVYGTSPYYSIFDDPLVDKCGSFTGGFVEEWNWNKFKLEKLSESQLWELYNKCKESWD